MSRWLKLLEYEAFSDPQKNRKYCLDLAGKFYILSMDIVTIVNELSKDFDY